MEARGTMTESLRDLRLFVAVYEERSFTAAARRENATQSGVSQHVRKIEDRLGARLFTRDGGTVAPTPAGHAYYGGCLEVLKAHEQADRAVRRFAGGLEGEIVIGLMPTMTRSTLAPALARFIEAHPNVAVRVVEGYSGDLTEQVRSGELAFAIVPPETEASGIRSTHFARTPELLISSRALGVPRFAPVRLAGLGPLRIVVPSQRNARRHRIDAYLAAHGAGVERRLELDTMFGTLDFVAQTDWVAILPGIMLVAHAELGPLQIHALADPPFTLDLIVIEPARRPMSQAGAVLLEALRDSAARLESMLTERLDRAAPAARR